MQGALRVFTSLAWHYYHKLAGCRTVIAGGPNSVTRRFTKTGMAAKALFQAMHKKTAPVS